MNKEETATEERGGEGPGTGAGAGAGAGVVESFAGMSVVTIAGGVINSLWGLSMDSDADDASREASRLPSRKGSLAYVQSARSRQHSTTAAKGPAIAEILSLMGDDAGLTASVSTSTSGTAQTENGALAGSVSREDKPAVISLMKHKISDMMGLLNRQLEIVEGFEASMVNGGGGKETATGDVLGAGGGVSDRLVDEIFGIAHRERKAGEDFLEALKPLIRRVDAKANAANVAEQR
jgi:hypothetical protein